MTTTPHPAATIRHSIPDDAPATAFAPCPVGAYRRGLEDRRYDGCYFNPYRAGSVDWWNYLKGFEDAKKEAGREL
jgi:hypothetical protein